MRVRGHTIATDPHNPDMLGPAETNGVEGQLAHTPDELRVTLEDVFRTEEPVLIEVPVGRCPGPDTSPEPAARTSPGGRRVAGAYSVRWSRLWPVQVWPGFRPRA